MVKVGVVGVGHLGKWHAQKYFQLENSELVGVYDKNFERAEEIAKLNNCKAYNTYEELLAEVDAIDISTTTTFHYELAKQAMEKGKHVLVEKPITSELWQAKELCELAKNNNLIFQVGHIERFNPVVLEVQNKINNPVFVESHRLAPFTPRGTEVPVVLDLMIHDIDLILAFIDSEIKSISASGASIFTNSTDIANARLEFENGAVANVTASRASLKLERKIRFFQQDSYISLDFQAKNVNIVKKSDQSFPLLAKMLAGDTSVKPLDLVDVDNTDVSKEGADALKTELAAFIDCIENNKKPAVDAYAGTRALAVAFEIMKIIKNKKD